MEAKSVNDIDNFYRGGIYAICNKWTAEIYIGRTSANFAKRWKDHIYKLRKKEHGNKKLQEDWDRYPESYWEFRVLEVCSPKKIVEREGYWASVLGDYNIGFICAKTFNNSPVARPVVQLSMSDLSVISEYASITQAAKIINGLEGGIQKCCHYNQISYKGYYWCFKENVTGFSPLAPNYKGAHSEYHKKIAAENMRKQQSLAAIHLRRPIVQFNLEGKEMQEFVSITEAARQLNIGVSSISNALNKRANSAGGYLFKYKKI